MRDIERPFCFVMSLLILAGGVLILDSATSRMAWFFTLHWERIDNGVVLGALMGTIIICLGIIFTFLSLLKLDGHARTVNEPDSTSPEYKE